MRKLFLYIIFLTSGKCYSQQQFFMIEKQSFTPVVVAQFNLTWTTSTVADWVTVLGNPNTSVLTGNDNRSGSTITISTIAIGNTYWTGNGTAAAGYITEVDPNGSFPAELGSGYFFNQQTTYVAGGNIRISGLLTSATYRLEVGSNRPTVSDNRLTTIACLANGTTETFNDVNSAPSTTVTNSVRSQIAGAGTVITFTNKSPNGSGEIFLGVCAAPTFTFGYINYIKITRIS